MLQPVFHSQIHTPAEPPASQDASARPGTERHQTVMDHLMLEVVGPYPKESQGLETQRFAVVSLIEIKRQCTLSHN